MGRADSQSFEECFWLPQFQLEMVQKGAAVHEERGFLPGSKPGAQSSANVPSHTLHSPWHSAKLGSRLLRCQILAQPSRSAESLSSCTNIKLSLSRERLCLALLMRMSVAGHVWLSGGNKSWEQARSELWAADTPNTLLQLLNEGEEGLPAGVEDEVLDVYAVSLVTSLTQARVKAFVSL